MTAFGYKMFISQRREVRIFVLTADLTSMFCRHRIDWHRIEIFGIRGPLDRSRWWPVLLNSMI